MLSNLRMGTPIRSSWVATPAPGTLREVLMALGSRAEHINLPTSRPQSSGHDDHILDQTRFPQPESRPPHDCRANRN